MYIHAQAVAVLLMHNNSLFIIANLSLCIEVKALTWVPPKTSTEINNLYIKNTGSQCPSRAGEIIGQVRF